MPVDYMWISYVRVTTICSDPTSIRRRTQYGERIPHEVGVSVFAVALRHTPSERARRPAGPDPAKPRRIGSPLAGHRGTLTALAFSPGGRTLAIGSADKTVIRWDLTRLNDLRDHLLDRACSRVGRA